MDIFAGVNIARFIFDESAAKIKFQLMQNTADFFSITFFTMYF